MTERSVEARIAGFFVTIGSLVMLAGFGIVALQCLIWLRFGEWMPVEFGELWDWLGWHRPETEWAGVQKIISFILSWPLSLVSIALGGLVVWVAQANADEIERRDAAERERKRRQSRLES